MDWNRRSIGIRKRFGRRNHVHRNIKKIGFPNRNEIFVNVIIAGLTAANSTGTAGNA